MTGTILNAAAIVLGGILGLIWRKPLPGSTQSAFKVGLGALTVFFGLQLTWVSLNGSFAQVMKQIAVLVLAMSLGKLTGRLCRLQKMSNRLGQFARERMIAVKPGDPNRFTTGFVVCAALFCAAPIGILGAVQDGLSGYFYPLLVKAVMEGLAAAGFVMMFGSGVLFSAVPVLVFQGSISLLCGRLALPWLEAHHLSDSVNAMGGLLVFCVAMIIFELRRIEVTDYLPSLVYAPLLTWWLLR